MSEILAKRNGVVATEEGLVSRASPVLPVEVWEQVIDHFQDWNRELKACALVCHAWYPRSRFHLLNEVQFFNQRDVTACARMLRKTPSLADRVWKVGILGVWRPTPQLSTAAMMLARRLPRLEELYICNAIWTPWAMHKDLFLHLSVFSSVTRLDLRDVTFPSLTVFGHVIYALPGLIMLSCSGLRFIHNDFNHMAFDAHRDRMKITELHLDGFGTKKAIEFFIFTRTTVELQKLVLGCRRPFNLQELYTMDFQQLLDSAGKSLAELQVYLAHITNIVNNSDWAFSCAQNTALSKVWLSTEVSSNANITWMFSVLSSVRSEQLRTVKLMLDVRKRVITLDSVLDTSIPAVRLKIDEFLSSSAFKNLTEVEVQLLAERFTKIVPGALQWENQLSRWFPQLMKWGIFRATSRVDLDRSR